MTFYIKHGKLFVIQIANYVTQIPGGNYLELAQEKTKKEFLSSIRLSESSLQKINELFVGELNFTSKIERCIDYLYDVYLDEYSKLNGYFSTAEAGHIASIYNGMLPEYDELRNIHSSLVANYEDSITYGTNYSSDEIIDYNELNDKLYGLSLLQAWSVQNSMVAFWESQYTEDPMELNQLCIVNPKYHDYLVCITCNTKEDLVIASRYLITLLEEEGYLLSLNERMYSSETSIKISCRYDKRLTVAGLMELKEQINTILRDIGVVADINIIS